MRREPFFPYEARDDRRLEIDGATIVADLFLPLQAGTAAITLPGKALRQQSRLQVVRNLRRGRPF